MLLLIFFSALFVLILLCLLLIRQVKTVKQNAIHLPEAIGGRESINNGDLSLLHLGESTVAGVGVEKIEQGLTCQIVNSLCYTTKISFNWQLLGKNGATVESTNELVAKIDVPDILLLTFGVNDTTKFTSKKRWLSSITECVKKFSGDKTQVFFTSIPPMQKFPLLPFPLSWLLGVRAYLLDYYLMRLCKINHWTHIKLDFESANELMASDGYHPNSEGYKLWAEGIAEQISLQLPLLKITN